jgi:hypothetical protein
VLLAHLEIAKNRAAVLSDLHAQIQDAFNEFGIQIMPHCGTTSKPPSNNLNAGPIRPGENPGLTNQASYI